MKKLLRRGLKDFYNNVAFNTPFNSKSLGYYPYPFETRIKVFERFFGRIDSKWTKLALTFSLDHSVW